MSSASAGRRVPPPGPNRYPKGPPALPYSLTPIGYMHSSKRSNSATGSWRSSTSSVSESSSCCSSSTRSRNVARSAARAAGGTRSSAEQVMARSRTRRISVDPLARLVLAAAAGAVAPDERQEHVVGVVPVAPVDRQGGPVGGRRRPQLAEEVAELAVRVAVLGDRHPRDARLPLVEALGCGVQAARGPLHPPHL